MISIRKKVRILKEKKLILITIFTEKEVECQIEKAKILANSTIIARNLVNEPSNVIYPKNISSRNS
uniref:Leucyl aminopeptidase n=1 Tax=Clostridioides difficile TaxID=1496 RepID=A0A381I9X1_CLODI|nr:leucyl aminopeptidase [Clostridioides difficile]